MRKSLVGTVLAGLILAGCATMPQSVVKKETGREITTLQNARGISLSGNEFWLLERDGRNYKFDVSYRKNSGIDSVSLVGYYGRDLEGKEEYIRLSQTDIDYSANPEVKALGELTGIIPLVSGVIPRTEGVLLRDLNGTMYQLKIGSRIKGTNGRKVRLESYFDYAPVQ